MLLTFGCNKKASEESLDIVKIGDTSAETLSEETLKNDPELKSLLANPNVTVEIEEITEDSTQKSLNHIPAGDTKEEHGWPQEAEAHMDEFKALVENDPLKARPLLSKVANARFGNNPLAEEWIALIFQMATEKRLSLVDAARYLELERDLLSIASREKYAKGIRAAETALAQLQIVIAMMKKDGVDPSKVDADITLP